MMRSFILVAVSCWTIVANAEPARERKHGPPPEARAHFEAGRSAFELGHFDEALSEFEASYKIQAAPLLLFNIAQTQRAIQTESAAPTQTPRLRSLKSC
jgi:hypothetical protein